MSRTYRFESGVDELELAADLDLNVIEIATDPFERALAEALEEAEEDDDGAFEYLPIDDDDLEHEEADPTLRFERAELDFEPARFAARR